jgi:hypothetical protein
MRKVFLRAGAVPPVPASLDDVWWVHVVDGDSSALCTADLYVEPVDDALWQHVPIEQRCVGCETIMGAQPL